MTKTIALMFATAALAMASDSFAGVVTDTMCGRDHKPMNMGADDKCVTECVKAGAKYALNDGKFVYQLSDQQGSAKFAGKKVKVLGTLDAKTKTIHVISIAAQ